MFLDGKQADRMKNYDDLGASERATFTYRMTVKITKFLADVCEVNKVLEIVPFKSRKKVFEQDHIEAIFDLLEKALIAQDVAPVIGNPFFPDDANQYVFKAFAVEAVDGKVARYSTTRPATPEEIARNKRIQKRIDRLKLFIYPPDGIPGPEFRPREYFDGLVEQAEKSGLKPIFEE